MTSSAWREAKVWQGWECLGDSEDDGVQVQGPGIYQLQTSLSSWSSVRNEDHSPSSLLPSFSPPLRQAPGR